MIWIAFDPDAVTYFLIEGVRLFEFSGGAADTGIGKLKFLEDEYTTEKLVYSDSEYNAANELKVQYFANELQRQGIEVAKSNGVHLGRPCIEFPDGWAECYAEWKDHRITAREAMQRMGLKKDSFYRLVKKYEKDG